MKLFEKKDYTEENKADLKKELDSNKNYCVIDWELDIPLIEYALELGWELISVTQKWSAGDMVYYFKRFVKDES